MAGGCWSLCTTYHIKSCTPQYSWKRTVASKTTDLHDCWRQKLLFGMIKCYINSTHHIGLPLHHPHPAALNIIQWIDSKMPCKLLTVVMRSSPPPQRQPGQGRPRIASTTYTWLCMVAVIPSNSSEWQSGTYRSYSLHDMPHTPFNMITVTWGNQPARPVACCKKLWAVSLQLNE